MSPREKEDKMYFGMFAYLKDIPCTKNNLDNIQTSGCGAVENLADRLNCKATSDSNHIRQWENVLYELIGFYPAKFAAAVDDANPQNI